MTPRVEPAGETRGSSHHELGARNSAAALSLCKKINSQTRKLEYQGRGLRQFPEYLPLVQIVKQEISSARAGVQQVIVAMEKADRLRQEAYGVKSSYERKTAPLFAIAQKNVISTMETLKEAARYIEVFPFSLNSPIAYEKFIKTYKREKWFPRFISDVVQKRGFFRYDRADSGSGDLPFGLFLRKSGVLGFHLDFSQANLVGVDLHDYTFGIHGILSFVEADLRHADLRNVKYGKMDFTRANLSNANLQHFRENDSNFTDAILKGTDLAGADLSCVEGLTRNQIMQARNWQKAKLPQKLQGEIDYVTRQKRELKLA